MKRPTLSDSELSVVKDLLCAHLPDNVKVHVFGSRAHGQPKAWSDLDLALEGPEAMPLSIVAALTEAFEESPLPWKVDIVDRKTASHAFGKLIDQSKVALG